jgi:hypothetical protein
MDSLHLDPWDVTRLFEQWGCMMSKSTYSVFFSAAILIVRPGQTSDKATLLHRCVPNVPRWSSQALVSAGGIFEISTY